MIIGAAVPTMIQMMLLPSACHMRGSVNMRMKFSAPTNGGLGLSPSKSTTE